MTSLRPLLSLLFLPALLWAQNRGATAEAAAPAALIDDSTIAAIKSEGLEHSEAMRLLRDLTKMGHRLTGSDNFTVACDWTAAEFSKMGLKNVHKEKWGQWPLVWNRGTWTGRITSPIELDMYVATEAWTASTNGKKQGHVFKAPKDDAEFTAIEKELKGAFLYGKKPGKDLRTRCEAAGIAGWVSASTGDAKYPNRVRVFGRHQTAMGSLDKVPTVPDIVVQNDHAKKLAALLDLGKDVVCEFEVDSEWKAGPIELDNVIAEIPGTDKPDEVVIVCGHLDSWHQAEGCTDNGTGTTSTMEAARILAKVGAKPKRTIRFILWGGEEEGLLGSAEYVKRHRTEMDKVSAVFNHDTGTNWAHRLSVTEAMFEPMQRVFAPVMQLTAPDRDFDGPVFDLRKTPQIRGGGGSDHASFIAAGVPGLDWGLSGRSDYFGMTWHSQWDKFDVAIPEYQKHTSTVIALAALGTANLPQLLDHSGVARGQGGRQATNVAQAIFDADMDGMKFTNVNKDGHADKLGFKPGDLLVKIAGEEVEQPSQIVQLLRDSKDDVLTLTVKRGQETLNLLAKKTDLGQPPAPRGRVNFAERLGAEVDGVKFTKVQKDGLAQKLGFQDGDELLKVDGEEIDQVFALFRAARDAAGEQLTLTVKRAGKNVELKVKQADLATGR